MAEVVSIGMDQAKFFVAKTKTQPVSESDWLPVYFKTLNYSANDVEADDTTSADFDIETGALWQSKIKTALGGGFSVESIRRSDPDTKTRDAAQVRIEEIALSVGHASKGWFRLLLNDDGTMWDFKATAKCQPFGGGLTDVQQFKADITIAGPPIIGTQA